MSNIIAMKFRYKDIVSRLTVCFVIAFISFKLILNYFMSVDNERFLSHIHSLGFSILIIFIPYFTIIFSDTAGWHCCFREKISKIPVLKLFLLRLASETLQTSLPGGAAYAELVRPYLLKKHFNLTYHESISADIITKINIMVAQVIFLLFGILILIMNFRENIVSVKFLPESIFYLTAAIFILLTLFLSYLLYRHNLLMHMIHLLDKINLKTVKRLLSKIRQPSVEINNAIAVFYKGHKAKLILTIAFFFLSWILMAFESLVILKVLTVDVDIFQMIIFESLISIIRMIFFFLPGAVGAQDVSIIMLFNLAGLPDPVLNSFLFIILKRSKELFWIIIGYALLIIFGIKIKNIFKFKHKEPEFGVELITKS